MNWQFPWHWLVTDPTCPLGPLQACLWRNIKFSSVLSQGDLQHTPQDKGRTCGFPEVKLQQPGLMELGMSCWDPESCNWPPGWQLLLKCERQGKQDVQATAPACTHVG